MHPSNSHDHRRAVVLGGGGSTGHAWLVGVAAGLYEAGVDLASADLVVGTSAGATVAVQLTSGADPVVLARAALAGPPPTTAASGPASRPRGAVPDHLERLRRVIAASSGPDDFRRRLGAAASEHDDDGWSERWRSVVAARLPGAGWAETVRLTAVDAATGEPVVVDRASGVDVVDAVAASCSSGFPYRIGDRRLLDGGYRRNENADLAEGFGRVVVFAPFGGRSLHPPAWRMQLAAQVEELRATGSEVRVVVPDAADVRLFGPAAMDPTLRPAAAAAGLTLGRSLADRLGPFWSGSDASR